MPKGRKSLKAAESPSSKSSSSSSGKEEEEEESRFPARSHRAPTRLDPSQQSQYVFSSPTKSKKRGRSPSGTPSTSTPAKRRRGPGRPKKHARQPREDEHEHEHKEYEVEGFLDAQLLVKWKGYSKSDSTWEPLDSLGQTCGKLALAYLDQLRARVAAEVEKQEEEEGGQQTSLATPKRKTHTTAK